jgi:hypothetical protein
MGDRMIDKLSNKNKPKLLRTDGSVSPMFRDQEIANAIKENENKKVQETLIMQKVNKAHREAFKQRFPGQLEHCMRLTAERLQGLLTSKPEDMHNTMTWDGSPQEIDQLCNALYHLSIMSQHYPLENENEHSL